MITVANAGNDNTGVLIKFKAHCIEEYSDPELSGGSAMLDAFTWYKGTVQNLLGGADMAFLLVYDSADVGGIAWYNTYTKTAGMGVKYGSESAYVVGHELGHILGATHDRVTDANDPASYPDGYGTLMAGTIKRTVMA